MSTPESSTPEPVSAPETRSSPTPDAIAANPVGSFDLAVPSSAEPRALSPLEPLWPDPDGARLPRLEDDSPPTTEQDAGEAPALEFTPTALELPAAWDERLHAGLTWEYCGPRGPGQGSAGPTMDWQARPGVPIELIADRVDYDQNTDIIELRGQVDVTQAEQRLEADRSTYDRRSGQLDASGDIVFEAPGLRILGEQADYNLLTRTGTIGTARYRLADGTNVLGTAEVAEMHPDGISVYHNITYSTCPPGNADWSIKARDLKLDQADGMGYAHHARIRIGKLPVLYTPYLFFPIDDRRRSGFLIPSFGSSSTTGVDISIPYYWNIAPNMDATITPRLMSRRGIMLGTELRRLDAFQDLQINAEGIPDDREDPDFDARGAVRILQTGRFGSRWTSSVDFAAVSDDQYLQDFGNQLEVTSVRNLVQRGDMHYAGDGWRFLTRIQQFQTVDPAVSPQNRPYGQLPHVELELLPKRWNDRFEYSLNAQYDFFDHDRLVHGNRLVAVPSLRMPLRRSFGQIVPRARLYFTGYDLINQTEGLPAQQSYLIPSFDLDGTLVFERSTNWFGSPALQTLEPRLYYVLTSFADQSNAPLFDTTPLDFSFASLFRPNRFTGYDRIGDENRMTLGLTSRTIANATGQELFRASIGQIYFFENRRVQLFDQPIEDDVQSSVAGEFAAQISNHLTARAGFQWNPNDDESVWEKRVLQLQYTPGEGRLLNLAYRFNESEQSALSYEDTDLSLQLPIGRQTKLVGRWLYSMLNNQTVEAFAGIEYGRCCWRVRLLGQHLQTGEDSSNTSILFQIELAGLGSFGNQIDKLLERDIYGYQPD
ncbi:organic solvent tolerance protein [Thiocapsa imhoffii]|uniref:LPS-assembly protein LptD n=1 Tax=Thiocapsa imhoffii TaxID=382777 RepID=A0A9X1BA02_9GAMM|nr:LPS-assembly protein LptD [Thiocapsa imhoffii]MBK1645576.1 organic solvent tolerance protein [Thiocapsa imhoffii]